MENLTPPLLPAEAQIEAEGAKAGPRPKTNPWIILAILVPIGITVSFYALLAIRQLLPKTTSSPTPSPSPTSTTTWKTYQSQRLGFTIKYPPQYFLKTEPNLVKISNLPDFENNEFATVITFQPLSDSHFTSSDNPQISEILNKIGYNKLSQKFGYDTSGNFLGDPPWGYYQIAIASQSLPQDSLLITTRIHRQDEMPIPEGGSGNQLINTATSILSTIKFSNITPSSTPQPEGKFCGGIAGLPCPTGFICKLDGNFPDAGGTCIPKVSPTCKIGGCSGELCLDSNSPDVASICLWKDEYACLKYSTCGLQTDGKCGWAYTADYYTCLGYE